MPIPKPKSGEKQNAYISRCMSAIGREYEDNNQAVAICHQQWRDRKKDQSLHSVKAHSAENYEVRYETFNGIRHAVVPVIMMVEGVHHGSHGPIYYPADELSKFPAAWNGRPVPVFHPQMDGYSVSCNDPQVIEERTVGQLFNTFWDGQKLRSEAWINVEKANKVYPGLMAMILSGQKIDVSTGLWSDDDMASGEWNGEHFDAIARNLRSDHLALLPGGQGACGWADGCGVRANSTDRGGNDVKVLLKARNPAYTGKEPTPWAAVNKSIKSFIHGYYTHAGAQETEAPPKTLAEMPDEMRKWVAERTLLGNEKGETWEEICHLPVVNPTTNALNEDALAGIPEIVKGAKYLISETKSSVVGKANALLRQEFGVEEPERKIIGNIIRAMAKMIGIKVQEDASHDDIRQMLQGKVDALDHPPQAQTGMVHFVQEVYDDYFIYLAMPSDAAPGSERKLYKQAYKIVDEKVELEGSPTEVVERTNYVEVTAQAAKKDEQSKPVLTDSVEPNFKQEVSKKMVDEKRKLVVQELVKNGHFCEKSVEWLETMEAAQFDQIVALAAKKEEPVTPVTPPVSPAPAINEEKKDIPKVLTFNEILATADPEDREMFEEGRKLGRAKKDAMVKGIMANKRNRFTEDQLKAKPLAELEALAELAVETPSYLGNAGQIQVQPPKSNERQADGTGVPEMPVMKWNKDGTPDFSHLNS